MTQSSDPSVEIVSAQYIRKLYADLRLAERHADGELTTKVKRERHPASPRAPVPICTRSQVMGYYDADGRLVAVTHRYLKPDGSLGASGREDPKLILKDDGTIIRAV